VLDESGVQIMSPHASSDPPQAQLVPPGEPWGAPGPRPPLQPGA
jgi:hypothetical protein